MLYHHKHLYCTGKGVEDSRPCVMWSLFYCMADTSGWNLNSRTPDNVYVVGGPDLTLDFEQPIAEVYICVNNC